ncbi:patatin-like phospholipase family protein [Mesonia maritima]|uniref:NTE family protein n=1 Tax=Mesonia maritima TaxID=1793873 RepID=A0ABU1K364_9FLAO|nr:patatin-like phospholipase family protein [Mesonia maritima]MDR6300053.1 NTE family protein [Mesonia maritima]
MKKILLFILLIGFGVFAQETPNKARDLKVGLVLSGGGAKGLAHIGALKVIEKAGIRVDYIGGSSMGAIIGSLYAAGYSPEELDSIFQRTNFNTLIQDDLPRGVKTFYEKEESERYAVSLPFDKFKVSFPSGLSKGQNIYNLVSQLTSHVNHINNFEKLPIPFFCIGTDIETGREVILNSGSLAQAVSASGAIPSLFSPVPINGRLITDGGVSNNYPVEELRKRGVDYIIGVDVQDSLVDRKDLQSAFEILTQVNNFRTIRDMREKRKLTDLYINPDITDFSILSFDKGKAIIDSGEEAALEKLADLQAIASRQNIKENLKAERKRIVNDSVYIKNIDIAGNSNYPRSYIRGKLKIPTDTKIPYQDLNVGINNLSATGNFKRVEYNLIPQGEGKNDLQVVVYENNNNTLLRFALHYDELYRSAALLNITHKSLFLTNDITSFDAIVGDNFRYDFSYYIDKGSYWSIGVNSSVKQFEHDVGFDFVKKNSSLRDYDVNQVEIDYLDFTNQFYVQTFLVKAFRFGLGLEHKYTKLETETIIENKENENLPFTVLEQSNLYSTYGYLELDTYDNAYFPSSGAHFRGDFHLYLFDSHSSFSFSEFSIAKGSIGYAFSPISKFSVRTTTETGFRLGNSEMNTLKFFLGGYGNNYVNNIEPFFGYNFLDLSGDSYIKALVEIDYEIFKKNHLIASYNIANVEDDLYKTGNWFSTPDFTGFAIGYGIETFLGPLEGKYSYSPERGESEWYLSLGFWF